MPSAGDEDLSEFAEAAQDAGISHYMMLTGVRQGVINMSAAGLYHIFEQRLMLFHRKQLLSPALENEKAHFKVSRIKEEFQAYDVAVETFGSWSTVDELRLVANTVKHAEGDSSEQRRIRRPDLFRDPRLQDFGMS